MCSSATFGILAWCRRFTPRCELAHAAPRLSLEQLKDRVALAIAHEKELVIDPDFFLALREHLPRIGAVDILLKRGRSDNELTALSL